MRRISLILSDVFLPEEVGPEQAANGGVSRAALDLPNLDWLLRFATRAVRINDWRSWLRTELGASQLEQLPVAQCCALGLLPPGTVQNAWLATPVHLEARLDHVRLADRGLIRLRAQERQTWISEFARVFGPDYALHDAGERGFLLGGASAARAASVDPARMLDADIGRALPSGPAAGELRRLGTEIEMWLHGAAPNTARERARERRVSALWLWGGGVSDAAAFDAIATRREMVQCYGGDPFLVALANLAGQFNPAPASVATLDQNALRTVVELAPMSGEASESLAGLDANWFAPLREALNAGQLDCVDVVANDRWFRIAARPGWRFWRRRSSWLAQFGRHLPPAA